MSALEKAEFKAEHPYPRTFLNCTSCSPGIPIYDGWSTERKISAYGKHGEECEVTSNVTPSIAQTRQPNSKYGYIDTEWRLYVRCPSGQGYVYTSHTTFAER